MKNLVLSFAVLFISLIFTVSLHHNGSSSPLSDTIFVGVAPSTLPEIDGNWEDIAFKTINQNFIFKNVYSLSNVYLMQKALKDQLVQVFKEDANAEAFYNWLQPSLLVKWDKIPTKEKIFIKETLNQLKKYLDSYSKEAEENYLSSNEKNFIKYRSSEYWDKAKTKPYPIEMAEEIRYMEAFLHRRINDGIKKETLIKYTDLLLSDLALDNDINYKKSVEAEMLEKITIAEGKKEGEWVFNQQLQYEGTKYILPKEIRNYENDKKEGEWKQFKVVGDNAVISVLKRYKNDELMELELYHYQKEKPDVLEEVIKYDVKAKEKTIEKYKDEKVVSTEKEKL